MAEHALKGLAEEWDATPAVRNELRSGKPLISEVSEKCVDIHMPSRYGAVLKPVLARMREAGKKLPPIEAFRCEVRAVLVMNKREPSDDEVHKAAWHLRKNCGFIKMKCRRQEVSTVSRLR